MTRIQTLILLALAGSLAAGSPASAQTPTEAQKHAIRSACPADYRANCADVPTGGMAALVCLEQHADKLSAPCQAAVKAVSGEPDAASPADAQKPAATAAPKSAAAPTSAAAPKTADAPKSAGAPKAAPAASPPPAAAARPPMPFFRELRLTARSCAVDFRLLCPRLPLGHGNALFCLKVHANRLTPRCRDALAAAGELP